MILLDNQYLLSEDIFEKNFVCNLNACKGACCWEGDLGAPLEEDELEILANIFDDIKPYLSDEGLYAIEKQGLFQKENEEYATTLINNGPCAYIYYDDQGIAGCAIEKAWMEGKTDFRKPISCHLYPIRLRYLPDYIALNYDRWDICKAACSQGDALQVPVYKFLKQAIERKFGENFYQKLEDLSTM